MTARLGGVSFTDRVAARVLCYAAPRGDREVALTLRVAALTEASARSGLVVRGPRTDEVLETLRATDHGQPLIVDPGQWCTTTATTAAPLVVPEPQDEPGDEPALFATDDEDYVTGLVAGPADGALTPSGFVRAGDWPALKAVLAAGAGVADARIATLVATDAAMLDPGRIDRLIDVVGEQRGRAALAFVFAAAGAPLASVSQLAGLRHLVRMFPGCLVLGTDVLVGADVLARTGTADGAAAIGLNSSCRRPRRPGDTGGPPAAGWIPGLFLRELWETRSPAVYEDWYPDAPAPGCVDCGGRRADAFTSHKDDRDAVLWHNVHAWLRLLNELGEHGERARAWLASERVRAFEAHRGLSSLYRQVQADPTLRSLCELDDPDQRRTTPAGGWR